MSLFRNHSACNELTESIPNEELDDKQLEDLLLQMAMNNESDMISKEVDVKIKEEPKDEGLEENISPYTRDSEVISEIKIESEKSNTELMKDDSSKNIIQPNENVIDESQSKNETIKIEQRNNEVIESNQLKNETTNDNQSNDEVTEKSQSKDETKEASQSKDEIMEEMDPKGVNDRTKQF